MSYHFFAFGHPNIRAEHKSTLEFTKDDHVTLRGDCIVGVRADFDLEQLKQFLKKEKVKLTVKVENIEEVIIAVPNPEFKDDKELVVRIGEFASERTFAVRADKASKNLDKNLISRLNDPKTKIEVVVE